MSFDCEGVCLSHKRIRTCEVERSNADDAAIVTMVVQFLPI